MWKCLLHPLPYSYRSSSSGWPFFSGVIHRKSMKTILLKPVEIIGRCPANLSPDDVLQIVDMNLVNPERHNACFLALNHFPPMVWQFQSESRFFSHASCPGYTSELEQENRVVFLLGHEDKWDLCLVISEYLKLRMRVGETNEAMALRDEAIQLQDQGEYLEALDPMRKALEVLKRAANA